MSELYVVFIFCPKYLEWLKYVVIKHLRRFPLKTLVIDFNLVDKNEKNPFVAMFFSQNRLRSITVMLLVMFLVVCVEISTDWEVSMCYWILIMFLVVCVEISTNWEVSMCYWSCFWLELGCVKFHILRVIEISYLIANCHERVQPSSHRSASTPTRAGRRLHSYRCQHIFLNNFLMINCKSRNYSISISISIPNI
jgi:hypothetical protein